MRAAAVSLSTSPKSAGPQSTGPLPDVDAQRFVDRVERYFPLSGEWWARWCGWIVLIVAPFIAYSNSFQVPFVFDGHNYIVEQPWIAEVWSGDKAKIDEFLTKAQTRPLAYFTFAVDHRTSMWVTRERTKPTGHYLPVWHTTSLAIHIIAGLALYGVARRAFRSPRLGGRFDACAERFALVIALVWVVHPLNTQSVTYLYQRHESLMGMFYFLTLYFFTRFAERGWFRWGWAGASFLGCLAGMVSKEAMATAPMVILWYDLVFVARSDRRFAAGFLRFARHAIPRIRLVRYLIAWVLQSSVCEMVRRRGFCHLAHFATLPVLAGLMMATPYRDAGIGDTSRVTPQEYAMTQFGVVRHYMLLSIYPVDLNIDYAWKKVVDWPLSDGFPYAPPAKLKVVDGNWGAIVFPALVVVGFGFLTLLAIFRAPALGFLAGSFFVILAPTSSLYPIVDYCFEHRMYVPLAPLLALILVVANAAFDWGYGKLTRNIAVSVALKTLVVILIVSAFVALTHHRNHDYRSRVALWEDVVRKAPKNDRAQYNFGVYLQIEGTPESMDEALAEYAEKSKTDPNVELKIAPTTESMDRAIAQYFETLKLNPSYGSAHLNLANIYLYRGQLPEALEHFDNLLKLEPYHPEGRYGFADVLFRMQRYQEARLALEKLLDDDPENANAKSLLAQTMEILDRPAPPAPPPPPPPPPSTGPTPTTSAAPTT